MREGVIIARLENGNYDTVLDANGKMKRGGTAQQEVEQLVISQKGEWKQFPVSGLGIDRWLKKTTGGVVVSNIDQFKRELKIELAADRHQNVEMDIATDLSTFEIKVEP